MNIVAKSVWKVLLLILAGCSQPLVPEEPEKPRPLDSSYSTTGSPSVYSILKEYNPPDAVLSPANTEDVPPQEKLTLHGRVLSSDDKPVANAVVGCWCTQWEGSTAFIGKVMTDAEGRYSIDGSEIRKIIHLYDHVADHVRRKRTDEEIAEVGHSYALSLHRPPREVKLFATDEKNAIGWANAAIVPSASKAELDIRLLDQSGIIAGEVVDEQGRPVVGQRVWLQRLAQYSDPSIESSECQVPFDWFATTDGNGKFVFSGLPREHHADVVIKDMGDGIPKPSADLFTSPEMLLDRVKAGHLGSNPCHLTKRKSFSAFIFRGKLIDKDKRPIAGAIVRGRNKEAKTNDNGEYYLELPFPQGYLHFEFPLHERIPAFQRPIEKALALRGKTQEPIEIHEWEWITGRVLSSADDLPVPSIKIVDDRDKLLAITNEQGVFRGLCHPKHQRLRMLPEFLSRSEQYFSPTSISNVISNVAPNERDERQIRDIRIPVNRPDDKRTRLRVVLPDGTPANEARVAIWTLNSKSPEVSFQSQSQVFNQDGKRSYYAVTNQDGICSFTSVIKYDVPQFAVVAYPVIDPKFFGELQLAESQGTTDSPPMELRLVPSRTLSGLVTFNGKPRQATRVIATPKAHVHIATGAGGQPVFPFIKFVSATDSLGRYSIQVPDASGYSVDVLDGAMDGVVRSVDQQTHERNLPVEFASNSFSVPDQGPIKGPTISFLQGDGVVRGKVLGSNRKPFYAPVHLDLPVGTVVLNLNCREDIPTPNGQYQPGRMPDGGFVLTGVPDGIWNAYATANVAMRKDSGDQLQRDSDMISIKAGDENKVFTLKRYSR